MEGCRFVGDFRRIVVEFNQENNKKRKMKHSQLRVARGNIQGWRTIDKKVVRTFEKRDLGKE